MIIILFHMNNNIQYGTNQYYVKKNLGQNFLIPIFKLLNL